MREIQENRIKSRDVYSRRIPARIEIIRFLLVRRETAINIKCLASRLTQFFRRSLQSDQKSPPANRKTEMCYEFCPCRIMNSRRQAVITTKRRYHEHNDNVVLPKCQVGEHKNADRQHPFDGFCLSVVYRKRRKKNAARGSVIVVVVNVARRLVGFFGLPVVTIKTFAMQHPATRPARHVYRGNRCMTAGQAERRLKQPNNPQFGVIFIIHGRTLQAIQL